MQAVGTHGGTIGCRSADHPRTRQRSRRFRAVVVAERWGSAGGNGAKDVSDGEKCSSVKTTPTTTAANAGDRKSVDGKWADVTDAAAAAAVDIVAAAADGRRAPGTRTATISRRRSWTREACVATVAAATSASLLLGAPSDAPSDPPTLSSSSSSSLTLSTLASRVEPIHPPLSLASWRVGFRISPADAAAQSSPEAAAAAAEAAEAAATAADRARDRRMAERVVDAFVALSREDQVKVVP